MNFHLFIHFPFQTFVVFQLEHSRLNVCSSVCLARHIHLSIVRCVNWKVKRKFQLGINCKCCQYLIKNLFFRLRYWIFSSLFLFCRTLWDHLLFACLVLEFISFPVLEIAFFNGAGVDIEVGANKDLNLWNRWGICRMMHTESVGYAECVLVTEKMEQRLTDWILLYGRWFKSSLREMLDFKIHISFWKKSNTDWQA